jgi:hypothetical protein
MKNVIEKKIIEMEYEHRRKSVMRQQQISRTDRYMLLYWLEVYKLKDLEKLERE